MNFSKKILFVSFSFLLISSFCLADKEFDAFDSYSRFDRMAEMKGMKIIARVKNAKTLQEMIKVAGEENKVIEEQIKKLNESKEKTVDIDKQILERTVELNKKIELLSADKDGKEKSKEFAEKRLGSDGTQDGKNSSSFIDLLKHFGGTGKEIVEINQQVISLKEEIGKMTEQKDKLEKEEKIKAKSIGDKLIELNRNKEFQGKILKNLERALERTLKEPGIADVVMKGIAGKDAGDSLEEIIIGMGEGKTTIVDGKEVTVTDVGEEARLLLKGAGYGVLFRTSNSIGKELGNSIDDFVGKGFSSGTGALIGSFSYFNNLIFHGGNVSFEMEEVGIWKSLIINDMRSLEKMLKDGGKNESRSRDMIERELGKDGTQKPKEQMRMIWNDFSDGFAEQCMYIVNEIGERKKHYKHKDLIVFYSSQLQKRLLSVAQLVLKMNSLKDFSTLGEINSIFPSITKNMERLFTVLEKQIKASQFSFGNKKSSSFSSSSYSNGNDDYSSNYPNSFS